MRRIVWPLVLVLSAATPAALAQASSSARPKVIAKGTANQWSCPIGFSAQRYGLTTALRETKNGPVSEFTQSLQLRFDPARTAAIERISVRVYGRTAAAQAVPVGTAQPSDVMNEPVELKSRDGRFDAVQYITTATIPLVTRVEITEIGYRDGTSWREPARGTCLVAPSLFVLVGATAAAQ